MQPNRMRAVGITAVASGLLLASGASAFAMDDGKGSVQVVSVDRNASKAGSTLLSRDGMMRTASMIAEFAQGLRRALLGQPFQLSTGNKVCVQTEAPRRKSPVINVGVIVDDGAPF